MSELSVWVTCFKNGRGKWSPHYGAYPTKGLAIIGYDRHRGPGSYAEDRRAGQVLAMKATLTLEQPKSTKRNRKAKK